MNDLSPVIIFVYKRVEHLRTTIRSLSKNYLSKKTDIIIFSDGPRLSNEKKHINNVRKFCKNIKSFRSVKIIERKKNIGLSRNIIKGVSKVLKEKKKAIILEDDMYCDKYFLYYMNFFLNKYKNNKKIVSIHGYNYPIKKLKKIPNFFFLKGADCWGWATWSNKWKIYNDNGKFLAKKIQQKNMIKEFNFNNTFDYYKMLLNCVYNKNDSWAIKWYASAFLKNKLTLYPKYSLINNIGMDGSGRHSLKTSAFYNRLRNKKIYFNNALIEKENLDAKSEISNFFISIKQSFYQKVFNKLKKCF